MNPVQTPLQTESEAPGATVGAGYGLLIFRLARASAWRLGRSLRESGLRWPEYAVLHHLDAQGPIAQRDLALALRIQPSNLVACSISWRSASSWHARRTLRIGAAIAWS